jgi:hypothetical protein
VYLRLLVAHSEDKVVREAFSSVLQTEGAMKVLQKDLQEGETAAPAYAFLASIVKDYGGVDAATELYSIATRILPSNTNSMLSYVHTLELSCKYETAIEQIYNFAAQNPDVRAGVSLLVRLHRFSMAGSVGAKGGHCCNHGRTVGQSHEQLTCLSCLPVTRWRRQKLSRLTRFSPRTPWISWPCCSQRAK